ncbi:MAG TPA: threonine aldolase, partial [Phycisphaerae bacterium]|nr:threonine aldolase [Phycisphaerae bacterium]
GQLASKMRFLSAQWIGMLENDVWLRNARQANHCAQLLEERLRNVPGISIMFPRQANSVFVDMPARLAQAVRERGWHFYTFIGGGARFMCSWNSSDADVEALAAYVDLTGSVVG